MMITTKPDVDPNGIYSLKQAADALHVERHTIKRYADNNYIRVHVRKVNNRKVTTGAEIIKCWRSVYL